MHRVSDGFFSSSLVPTCGPQAKLHSKGYLQRIVFLGVSNRILEPNMALKQSCTNKAMHGAQCIWGGIELTDEDIEIQRRHMEVSMLIILLDEMTGGVDMGPGVRILELHLGDIGKVAIRDAFHQACKPAQPTRRVPFGHVGSVRVRDIYKPPIPSRPSFTALTDPTG